jgi:acetyltransferase-like isoleucine patch superfamily enzyme
MRLIYWRAKLRNSDIAFMGRNAQITANVEICIGSGFYLGEFGALEVGDSDPVFIGKDVGMGRGAYLRSANHKTDLLDEPLIPQGHVSKKIQYRGSTYSIVIEDDVLIGANCIILTGAHIGTGSVISAGSVVASEIPPYSVAIGNPARVMLNRKKMAEQQMRTGAGNG